MSTKSLLNAFHQTPCDGVSCKLECCASTITLSMRSPDWLISPRYSQVAQEALEERRDSSAHLSKSERPKRERGGKKKHQQQHPDSEEADNMPTLSGLHLPSSSPTGTGGVAAPGMAQPSTAVRIAVMGAARVGKSSLIQQFLYGRVPKQHNATVEELHRRDYGSANGGRHRLTLELLDTSGSYQFPAMRQLAITTAQAFILVYAIDDQESFEEVRRLRNEIQEARSELGKGMPPVVVVGNKADLAFRRCVGYEVAETVATIDWEHGYVECSALEGLNVTQVFHEVLMQSKLPEVLTPSNRRRQSCPAQVHSHKRLYTNGAKRHSCIIS
ncbi:hypothetical protein HPB49_026177 [Dermacentor silvarum]|nr:hypothetical protein HPB49_026177 [Dermacentor silvarum]